MTKYQLRRHIHIQVTFKSKPPHGLNREDRLDRIGPATVVLKIMHVTKEVRKISPQAAGLMELFLLRDLAQVR